jgi:hypothetical protein
MGLAFKPWKEDGLRGREFFRHFGKLYAEACRYHRIRSGEKMIRCKIVSGGQTGVDRAALDIAIELGLEYGGWCPKGGWAEDLLVPPGLLSRYPKLQSTPLEKPEQRTDWNVRDSDATLILIRGAEVAASHGTEYTVAKANEHRRRCLILDLQDSDRQRKAMVWLEGLGAIHVLNIAGPRESEAPGIYAEAKAFLRQILPRANRNSFRRSP